MIYYKRLFRRKGRRLCKTCLTLFLFKSHQRGLNIKRKNLQKEFLQKTLHQKKREDRNLPVILHEGEVLYMKFSRRLILRQLTLVLPLYPEHLSYHHSQEAWHLK